MFFVLICNLWLWRKKVEEIVLVFLAAGLEHIKYKSMLSDVHRFETRLIRLRDQVSHCTLNAGTYRAICIQEKNIMYSIDMLPYF